MDKILNSLFSTSNKVTVNFINAVFQKNISDNNVEITIGNNNCSLQEVFLNIVKDDFSLQTDLEKEKSLRYHIEIENENGKNSILVFEYGFNTMVELEPIEQNGNTLFFPKALVLYIEETLNIDDTLKVTISFPNANKVDLAIPIIKYWEYSFQELVQNKFYQLLPLKILYFRKPLEILVSDKSVDSQNAIKDVLEEAKNMAFDIAKKVRKLYEIKEISLEDANTVLLAVQNLIENLNREYGFDDRIENEFNNMLKSLFVTSIQEKR